MGSTEETRLLARLQSTTQWLLHRPTYLWMSILIAASFLRSGFVIWDWFDLSPMLITEWSSPGNAFQSNVLFNALGTLWDAAIGPPEGTVWLIFQIVLTVGGLVWITLLVHNHTSTRTGYLGAAIVLSTGISTVLWREIGRYDVLFLVAISIAVLTMHRWLWIVAFSVAAISAPEQSILAAMILLSLSVIPDFAPWRVKAGWFLGLATTAAVGVQMWFAVAGDPATTRIGATVQLLQGDEIRVPSRFDLTQSPIQLVIEKFYQGFSNGPGLLWSYLGAVSLVFIIIILRLQRPLHMIWLIIVVVVFPVVTTIFFGEDPTRDLTIVTAPALIALIAVGLKAIAELLDRSGQWSSVWKVWSVVAIMILPALYFFVEPEAPFDFAIHMLTSWNNGTPIDWSGNAR